MLRIYIHGGEVICILLLLVNLSYTWRCLVAAANEKNIGEGTTVEAPSLIDASPEGLGISPEVLSSRSEAEVTRLRVSLLFAELERRGVACKARFQETESSSGNSRYHEFSLPIEAIALIDLATIGGLEATATIGAFKGAYTPKSDSSSAMESLQALLNA